MKTKEPQCCTKCGHLIVSNKDIVGMGWIVCMCDHKKSVILTPAKEIDRSKPFVFKDNDGANKSN